LFCPDKKVCYRLSGIRGEHADFVFKRPFFG
jgi:hypothetical protein